MSRLFINRPIFAWVLAIIVMLGGVGALFALPIEQYPDIAPAQVNIRASYPGASAEAIENSVTQVLEQQLTGIDGLLYFSSQSSARGQANITAIFAKGTDPDIAQVQVQEQDPVGDLASASSGATAGGACHQIQFGHAAARRYL